MNKLSFLLLGFLVSFSIHSQETSVSKKSIVDNYRSLSCSHEQLAHTAFFDYFGTEMGLDVQDKFELVHSEEGKNGYTHYKYNQYHKDILVYGSTYVLHEQEGKVVSANGRYLPQVRLETEPVLSEEQALEYAMQDMDAEIYTWEIQGARLSKSQQKPLPILVIIDEKIPLLSGNYRLAYKIDLRSQEPFDAQTYFVDAFTGRIIKKITLLKGIGVPGKGQTKYYGERTFTVDSIAPSEFVLHDPTRCTDGITIYNDGQDVFTSMSSAFDLQNEDQDEVALDAHFMTTEFYDRLRDEFDWLGIDNKNGSMNVAIHANGGQDFINAFWDGELAWFGDGDCNNGPLTTLEVLAHEFMHGIVDYTSELIYSDESGAINESLADVMGHYMENEIDPENFSWSLGNSFALVYGLEPFRVMDNPTVVGNPEFYQGPLWEDGADVHSNSSLGNLVYVVLSDGKMGSNLTGDNYNITGMGRVEAAKFLFYVNRNYLTASSNYHDYYEACLLASDEYFPGDDAMKENIAQAWSSVSIPNELAGGDEQKLSINSTGFVESCEWGEYGSAEFTVTNNGKLPYTPDMGGTVAIDASVGATDYYELIELAETIMPGEQQSFVIDSFMLLTSDFFFVDYDLYLDVENQGDDFSSDFYFVTEYVEDDLSIRVRQADAVCFQDGYQMDFIITNESCMTIVAGQEVKISLEDENGVEVWREDVVIENDLMPDRITVFERELELQLSESVFYEVKIENENDPNDENNINFAPIMVFETLGINYFNGFDQDSDLENGIVLETSSFGSNIIQYQGTTQFFTTGFFEEVDSPLCMDPDDNWVNSQVSPFGNVSAQLDGCLDLTGSNNPVVHFEMHQFRNDFMAFPSEQSSSVRFTAEQDGEQSHQIISGLAEGIKEEFNIPLPKDFRGSIQMKFITQSGVSDLASDFLLHDVVFMDNFAILETTPSEDLLVDNSIQLFPNPVSGRLNIHSNLNIIGYSVHDVSGKALLSSKNNRELNSLDVSGLYPGYYVIKFQTATKVQHQASFIKI